MANAESPVDEKNPDMRTVSNNNWWGSWINSAKSKVCNYRTIKKNQVH